MPTYIGDTKNKWYLGNNKIKKIYLGNTKLYSAGNIVTYMVDSDVVYQEEIDEGLSCLSPTTFTPTKSGWTFKGWRSTADAVPEVYSSLIMGDTEITLYAVFQQSITLSYNGNGESSGSVATQTGYRYYNNGTIVNASFTLSANGYSRTSYKFLYWSVNSSTYAPSTIITLSSNTIAYARWQALAWTTVFYTSGWASGVSTSNIYTVATMGKWALVNPGDPIYASVDNANPVASFYFTLDVTNVQLLRFSGNARYGGHLGVYASVGVGEEQTLIYMGLPTQDVSTHWTAQADVSALSGAVTFMVLMDRYNANYGYNDCAIYAIDKFS